MSTPLIECGTKEWYLNDKLHRIDGPAVECLSGEKHWYLDGEHHRIDGPAVEWADGTKMWYINDKLHRVNGPAIEYSNGTKEWYLDGKLHRDDGPAIEYSSGAKAWYFNGKLTEVEDSVNDQDEIDEKSADNDLSNIDLDDILAEITKIRNSLLEAEREAQIKKNLADEASSIHARAIEQLSNVRKQIEKLYEKAQL